MGRTDRAIRTTVGLVIAGLGLVSGSWLGLAAVLPLGTALIGFCPLYTPFEWSTRDDDNRSLNR